LPSVPLPVPPTVLPPSDKKALGIGKFPFFDFLFEEAICKSSTKEFCTIPLIAQTHAGRQIAVTNLNYLYLQNRANVKFLI
jgi:hypothetical protein